MVSKVLRDIRLSRNQPLKSADYYYMRLLKKKLLKLKKQEDTTL
jgi:ribosomal protein L19